MKLALPKWREQSCTECFSALGLLCQELIAILWGWQQWSLGDTSAHPDQCRGRDKSAVSDWQRRAFVTKTNVNALTESWWILNYSAGFCKYIYIYKYEGESQCRSHVVENVTICQSTQCNARVMRNCFPTSARVLRSGTMWRTVTVGHSCFQLKAKLCQNLYTMNW